MTAAVVETETVPAVRRTRLLLIILGSLSAIGPLSIDMYLPALPAIAAEMGAGAAQVQLSLTACLIGISAGQIVAGPLSDVRGRRGPLLIGIAAYAAASLLCAFSPSVYGLVGFRLLQGVAGGAALVIVRAVVRDLYEGAEIARIFATLMLVTGLAPILAPIMGAQLLNHTSWRGVFVALSVAGLLLLAAALFGVRETLPAGRRKSGGLGHTLVTFWHLMRDRSFMASALAGGFGFAAMFAYISGSPFVLQEVYGVSPQTFSLVFALNALGLTATAQVGGRMAGRWADPGRLILAGLFVQLAGAAALLVTAALHLHLAVLVAGLFVMMCGAGFVLPGAGALALAGQPQQIAGSASALSGVLQFALGAFAAPLVGLGSGESALPMAVVLAAFTLVSLAAFTGLRRSQKDVVPA
ncbi:DHA1 family bicyclomycin/chloramphenicol resistance-like MFS transporter [Streptosporangium becharense]|uniref:DHA1 family bicyclomycin/chloramphenicol resistance-like MFS transporter n=1 Tax=Streptosporangium becharense TaxID=1816182 RepID=A0A7W9IBZ5_9ACTN|nr:multidrug effflux MFS transporter [Streptosporangium becharense]MBB2915236.1 DHA1 family bicyclomycin/chloramphenicol resistance-like MFS transporter [Streptosporangium becharense]MBB5817935.1 DHA1 family bicyclomycin/chloramphenicol resistance-like MFS transporter [Streptosporangium becharense]